MDTDQVRLIDAVAFVCELATLAAVVVGVNGLIDGWRSWLIGVPLAIAVAVGWGRWAAPSSEHRLDDPARFIAQAMLFAAVGALLAVAGYLWAGVVLGVASTGAFALTRSDRMI